MELEGESAGGTLAALSIAMGCARVSTEWESLGKALVQIHVAEVELRWAAVAWEAGVVVRAKVERWRRVRMTTTSNWRIQS